MCVSLDPTPIGARIQPLPPSCDARPDITRAYTDDLMTLDTTQYLVPLAERATAFEMLVADVRACTVCERMAHAHVLGEASGPLDARLLFVAEAVGRRGGAVTGVPLTRDESGKRFTSFLTLAGIDRGDVFITNTVLCNPLDAAGRNRAPMSSEIARCRPFLARTLEIVRAPIVVTLGRFALESLRVIAPHDADLRRDAGTAIAWHGRTLVPLYHPSRQSTLHRAQSEQEADWRRLAAIFNARTANRTSTGRSDHDTASPP